ncbi:hypothetical protein LTR74_017953 [Friedmanniomyces endolithicus]|nr:hypothetical protein LTR74_017953 [Friedmanniomyces endolithicus]
MLSYQEAIKAGQTSPDNAWAIFDSLPVVSVDFMLGLWKASGFSTHHPQDGKLESAGWYGKRFTDTNFVDPMIFYANDGGIFSADPVYVTRYLSTMKRASDVLNEMKSRPKSPRLAYAWLKLGLGRQPAWCTTTYQSSITFVSVQRITEDNIGGVRKMIGELDLP